MFYEFLMNESVTKKYSMSALSNKSETHEIITKFDGNQLKNDIVCS